VCEFDWGAVTLSLPVVYTNIHDKQRARMSNREQVSVPLPPDLRVFVQRVAEAEDQTMASVIRRLVAAEARRPAQERPA
jgi:hypothetical protein